MRYRKSMGYSFHRIVYARMSVVRLSSHSENCHISYKGLTKTLPYVCRIDRHDKGKHFLKTNNTLKEVLNDKLTNKSAEIQRIRVRYSCLLSLLKPAGCLSGYQIQTLISLRILSDTVIGQCFSALANITPLELVIFYMLRCEST